MKITKYLRWIIIVMSLLVLLGLGISIILIIVMQPVTYISEKNECIDSFDTFAFKYPKLNGTDQEEILPLPPWEEILSIPKIFGFTHGEVEAVLNTHSGAEVWLTFSDSGIKNQFLVFNPELQEWVEISSAVKNTLSTVDVLSVSNEQSVRGLSISPRQIIISEFNRIENAFLVRQVISLESLNLKSSLTSEKILITPEETVWILSGGDAIFRFEPDLQEMTRLTPLKEKHLVP